MILREERVKFTSMLCLLLNYCMDNDYIVAIDMAKRCADCLTGHPKSLHKVGLAVDLLLYDHKGNYLTDSEAYKPLAEYWESIGGTAGYRFNDGNHFSLAWGNMR